jgi:hypothetical protein
MNECVGQLSFPQDNQGGFPAEKPYSNATAEVSRIQADVCMHVKEIYSTKLCTYVDMCAHPYRNLCRYIASLVNYMTLFLCRKWMKKSANS